MAARFRPPSPLTTKLGTRHREAIQASMLLRRLQDFIKVDPDRPKPGDIKMTRTQVHAALALLKKVMPDLASVEVSGNPEKPLVVQVVRFGDGETPEPQPMLDVTKLIEMDKAETAEIEAEAKAAKRRKNGHD